MFENLADDLEFRTKTTEDRIKYLDDYKQNVVMPMFEQNMVTDEAKRKKVLDRIDQDFAKVAYKSSWEAFKDSAVDLVLGVPGRALTTAREMGLPIEGAIASGLDAVFGDTAYMDAIKQKATRLQQDRAQYTYSADAAKWNDAAATGAGFGSLMGSFMYRFTGMASNWAQPFLQATQQGIGRAAATSAFTNAGGEVLIEAAMDKYVGPTIDKTDWDEDTKQVAKMASYMVLGFGSGMTIEYKMDKVLGNPLFRSTIEETVAAIKSRPFPELTQAESALKHLTSDPEKLRRLGQAFSNAEVDASANLAPDVASHTAQQIKLQNMIDSELASDASERAMKTAAGVPTHRPLTDVEQSKMLANMIQQSLSETAAKRATDAVEPDYHTMKMIDESDEVGEMLNGAAVGGADTVEAPKLTWAARVNSEDKIVLRASAKPSPEVLKRLKSVGLQWQPKKLFNTGDVDSAGVFYGPRTPEAHALVKEIFETNGQPVSKRTSKGTAVEQKTAAVQGKPLNQFSVSELDGNVMVRVNPENEQAVVKLGDAGYAFDEKQGMFVGQGKASDISKTLQEVGLEAEKPTLRTGKSLMQVEAESANLRMRAQAAKQKAAEAKKQKVLNQGWRTVVEDGKPTATPVGPRKTFADFRWISGHFVKEKFPLAFSAMEKVGWRSLNEGWTYDDIMRNAVDMYNKFKPGMSVDPEDLKIHMDELRQVEDLLETGWKHQPGAGREMNQEHIDNLVKGFVELRDKKIITIEQYNSLAKVINNFGHEQNFLVRAAAADKRSFYSFLSNTMYIRRADDFFHETGHWAWLHVLGKEDRLKFFELAITKYGNTEAWDGLWPLRRAYGEAADSNPKKFPLQVYTGHFQSVTELYADLFRRYVHTHHLPDDESRGLIAKMLKTARRVYKDLVKPDSEIPKDMRRFVEHVLKAPTPRRGKMRLAEVEDLVQRTALYQDRETFTQTLQHALDGVDRPMQDEFLLSLLTRGETAIDAWKRSGADIEGLLSRVYTDVLAHHHIDVGEPKQIETVLERFAEVFNPKNKADVVEQLKAMDSRAVKSKYGEVTEGSQTTAPNVSTAFEVKRKMAQQAEATEEHYTRGAEQHYAALKQFFNDVGALHQASKLHKKNFPKSGKRALARAEYVKMTQEEWGELQAKLVDEELARRGEHVGLDIDGNVDEFRLRQRLDGDEGRHPLDFDENSPFQNAFAGWSDDELRMVQWQTWPQVISAGFGIETDSENGVQIPGTNVRLNWSAEKWLTSGWGPALSAHGLMWKGLKGKTKQLAMARWSSLSAEDKAYITQKFNSVRHNEVIRSVLPSEGLAKNLQEVIKQKRRAGTAIKTKFYEHAEAINRNFSIDEQRMIAELVTKNGDLDVSNASPRVRATAEMVNRMFGSVKQDLIAAGVPESVVARYGQDFLPQVFGATAKNWFMQGGETRRMKNLYETINAKFLAPVGITNTLKHGDAEVQGLMTQVRLTGGRVEPGMKVDEFIGADESRVLAIHQEGSNALHTWEVKEFDTQRGKLVLNRAHTRLERQMLKEELSVVPRLVEFGQQASKFLAQSKAMQQISRMEDLVADPKVLQTTLGPEASESAIANLRNRGFVLVPESESLPGIKRYGQLAGKLVDPEAMYVLKNITSTAPEHPKLNAMFQKYKMGVGLWKIGKTAFNVTTHGINFIGNSAMCVMDGRNPADVLVRGAKALYEKGTLYHQAVEAGMLDSNILRSELGLEDFMRRVESQTNRHASEGFNNVMASWMEGVGSFAKKAGSKAAYWPMRIYELGDQVYKMGVFAQGMDQGLEPEKALQAAHELFFDYSDVPKGVKFIRDWGVLPFVSYTYKLIPKIADFAVNNPHRILGLVGGLELGSQLVMSQEWGEDFEDVREWQQDMMPDWMNRKIYGAGPRGGVFAGEQKNKYGHEYSQWVDYSQVIPGADLLNDGGILRGMPFGTNPILSILYGLQANKDAHLGQQIAPFPEADNAEMEKRNVEARLKFVARTLLPNLPVYPGAYSLERLGQGLVGSGAISPETGNKMGWTGKDYYGTQEDIVQEMFGYMTGIKPRRLYAKQETVRRLDKLQFGIKKEENELERKLQDLRTSPSEREQQIDKFKAVNLHNTDQLDRLGKVYRKAQKAIAQQQKDY